MEYESEKQPGAWERLKESPRTVSALIIILVVAAAIYAFSGNDSAGPAEESPTPETQTEEASAPAGAEEVSTAATPEPVAREVLTEQSEALPQVTTTAEGYVEAAEAGDGMTHLARRAATRWLTQNNPGYSVTNEHRIFIEDYIQKKMESPRLEVGENQTVSFGLIEEAVAAAGELTPRQLNNLTQYTYVLE